MPQSESGVARGDRAVAEDGDDHFILADDGLVGDPLVRRLRIQRPQAGPVGLDNPCPLRRLAAGLPAEDDLAGHPRIGLHVADLETDVDDELYFPGLEVHAAQTACGLAGTRAESRLECLPLG